MPSRVVPEAIFFDVDGVLIDSLAIKGEAFAHAFRDVPDRHDEIVEFHLAHGGVTRSEKLALMYQLVYGRAPTPDELEVRLRVFADRVADAVISAPEVRGAGQALAEWAGRAPLHAVSATPSEELVSILNKRGISQFFTSIRGWPPKKVDVLRGLLYDHGYEPDRCVLVGDSREDLNAAQPNQVRFVQVSSSPQMDMAESAVVIRDLVGLRTAIESVLRLPKQ